VGFLRDTALIDFEMDPTIASRMSRELLRKRVGGWYIQAYLGSGKSAVVFQAVRNRQSVALKIFDPDLVERFGRDVQIERLSRELLLKGKRHPHLVEILDGGYDKRHDLYYVAMSLVHGSPLSSLLETFPSNRIAPLIAQVASAALFLEEMGLAHRDIKPDNIYVSPDYSVATLLDLGVVRPAGTVGVTDGEERPFIGTLQYSSPEYLLRTEQDTTLGWRALTFYQLGAVLHDLIMRRPLFADESSPYGRLVEAVLRKQPIIDAGDLPPALTLIAKSCLIKNPDLRLRLVKWNDFEPVEATDALTLLRERILKRRQLAQERHPEESIEDEAAKRAFRRTLDFVEEKVQGIIRGEAIGTELFPPLEIGDWGGTLFDKTGFSVRFAASDDYGLKLPLTLLFRVEIIEQLSVAIRLKFVACNCVLLPEYKEDVLKIIFEGPFEETVVAGVLRTLLYSAMDQAQVFSEAEAPVQTFFEGSASCETSFGGW
jgi:hypothetical protein